MLVLIPFFVAPILVVLAASFFQSDGFGGLIADPTFQNYTEIFSSKLTPTFTPRPSSSRF